jgi:uncharacterized protein (DUF1778 family)
MGRPPKPEHKKYSERMVFMALPSERAAYEQAAAIADKELSEWMRDTLNQHAADLIASVQKPTTPDSPKQRGTRKTAQ